MAVLREPPICPKCGKKMIGRYKNQSHIPISMQLIGDTFIGWEHDGPCAENTESLKGLLSFISNDNPSPEDFYKPRGIFVGLDPGAGPDRTVLATFDSEGKVLSYESTYSFYMSYSITRDPKLMLTYCVATKSENDKIEILELNTIFLSEYKEMQEKEIKTFIDTIESKYKGIQIKQFK